ncbi:MAG: hypothetical protein J6Y37_09165 [Paludibacteraceae bacterium]|nr:hypothetical protein [Paludibacteraceae bacterium]
MEIRKKCNRTNKNFTIMRFLLTILLFWAMLPHIGFSQNQEKRDSTIFRSLKVLKDSGSVAIAMTDLTDSTTLLRRFFTNVNYVKQEDESTLLLKQKNAIKPQTRIEVSKGRLCLLAERVSCPVIIKLDANHIYTPDQSPTSRYTHIVVDSMYKKGMNISAGVVKGLPKDEKSLEVRLYDNYSNKLIASNLFYLIPEIIHEYYPEVHYTDAQGKKQVYKEGCERLEPLGADSTMTIVVKDEYGKVYPVVSYSYSSWMSMGNTIIPTRDGDTIPAAILRFRSAGELWIRPNIEEKSVRVKCLIIKK